MLTLEEKVRLGQRLKDLRKERGVSRSEVAQAWGNDPSNVAHIEAGRHNVSVAQLVAFARLVKVDPSELLSEFALAPDAGEKVDAGEAA